jgi:pSer/pThr/pTyr-binding forkhead associated (FHA) protein
MSLLELGGKRFAIPAGEVVLGSDAGCAIQLTGAGLLPRHAVLQGLADGQVVIRKAAADAEVMINGVRLGAEPTPLLHGDKVQVGGHELTFVDERRSGSTQYISAMKVPEAMAQAKASGGAGKATSNTGGRVVCLTDGREYTITGTSLVFGREAGCDVVVPGKDVSRRHAEILASPKGYLLVDSSTNGSFVNEERVSGQRVLARGDVIRIGDEQFRFYADLAPTTAGPPPGPAVSAPAAAPRTPPQAPPPAPAVEKLRNTAFGAPAVPAPPAAPSPRTTQGSGTGGGGGGGPLAHFLVRSGALKGQRLPVRSPVANIGRADYNDVAIADESVSTSHAKLQRREGVWVLVDLESTNGTWVDGEPVKEESPLAPGSLVRLGDVQMVFEPTGADDAMGTAKGGGTKVIQAMKPGAPPPPKAPAKAAVAAPAPPTPAKTPAPKRAAVPPPVAPKKGKGCGSSAAMVLLGVVGVVVYWLFV